MLQNSLELCKHVTLEIEFSLCKLLPGAKRACLVFPVQKSVGFVCVGFFWWGHYNTFQAHCDFMVLCSREVWLTEVWSFVSPQALVGSSAALKQACGLSTPRLMPEINSSCFCRFFKQKGRKEPHSLTSLLQCAHHVISPGPQEVMLSKVHK